MQYLGGKSRVAKHFVPYLSGVDLYEPFVGAFNIAPAVSPRSCWCSDVHTGLIEMYVAIQRGWEPPDRISESLYTELKERKDRSPLGVFASFAASFGGKEWGGFARDATGKRDLTAEGAVALRRKIPWIKRAIFRHSPFDAVTPCPKTVVYADPPYSGTTGYKTGGFDHAKFVTWCNRQADRGCQVFVSEFANLCPDRWDCVWSRDRSTSIAKGAGIKTECLFKVRS